MSLRRVASVIIFLALLASLSVMLNGTSTRLNCKAQVALESSNPQVACISLIDDDLSFPRNVISINGNLWLVDKGTDLFSGGYAEGILYRYLKTANGFVRETILEDLLDPNDVDYRVDKDGQYWVYISTAKQVFRLRADLGSIEQTVETRQNLINNIPTDGWHKLTAIEVNKHSLWLTVPSASDHCESGDTRNEVNFPCDEMDALDQNNATALIRRYDFDENDQLTPNFEIAALGLRDALAVALNPRVDSKFNAQLLAADNGWDQIDLNALGIDWRETPADELNVIDSVVGQPQLQHFGWPYCYADNQITHPYKTHIESCEMYQPPWLLLQAHSAPLGMIYHQDRLWLNLHGARPEAGRTIVYKLNEQGLPIGDYQVLVDWAYADAEATRGRPLGLASGAEKELFITDDWGQRLMRVMLK